MEPCHRDSNTPNAIRELPFVTYPAGSVQRVAVELAYPDDTTRRESFARAGIRLD